MSEDSKDLIYFLSIITILYITAIAVFFGVIFVEQNKKEIYQIEEIA